MNAHTPGPPMVARRHHCAYCGADMGPWNAYCDRNDTCGERECERYARDAAAQERDEAHEQLDRDRKPSEVLYAAAEYIRVHGWTQFQPVNRSGGVCMTAAVRKVMGLHPAVGDEETVWKLFKPTQSIFERVCGTNVASFNNHECKSADDAVTALEILADIAHAEGQ